MLATLVCVIRRDLLLAFRRRSDMVNMLFFFIVVVSLFPLGVGPEPGLLRTMAPGILWVSALLASMLALGRLFALDYADGALEQMLLSAEPIGVIVIGKVIAHWLVSGFPLVLFAPLLAVQFDLPSDSIRVLFVGLLLGTPVLSLIGSIGAALTLGARGGGALVSLLVLPLYIPVLIFGTGAVAAQASGIGAGPNLLLLGGGLAAAAALAPWACSVALRIALE